MILPAHCFFGCNCFCVLLVVYLLLAGTFCTTATDAAATTSTNSNYIISTAGKRTGTANIAFASSPFITRRRRNVRAALDPPATSVSMMPCNPSPSSTITTRKRTTRRFGSFSQNHDENYTSRSRSSSDTVESKSPLSMTFDQLCTLLEGKGRAKVCWDCYRLGIDPIDKDPSRIHPIVEEHQRQQQTQQEHHHQHPHQRQQQQQQQEKKSQLPTLLGKHANQILNKRFRITIRDSVSDIVAINTSADGTTKVLLKLCSDQLEVETVIIPWDNRKKSTLCISSQIGCKQGCTFCMTGKMGKLRSLTADEILSQIFWANHIIHQSNRKKNTNNSEISVNNDHGDNNNVPRLHPIDNIVFMGMGEPADNIPNVAIAANTIVDHNLFAIPPKRVTVSTVGPNPQSFIKLCSFIPKNVPLAWSVHSSRDEVRKSIVPTTRHSMNELRDGLIDAMLLSAQNDQQQQEQQRSRRKRMSKKSVMLELTLLDRINDSIEDAHHLVKFIQPIIHLNKSHDKDQTDNNDDTKSNPKIKVVVNLIPWNDIHATIGPASHYKKPSLDRILDYQNVLKKNDILCYIRTTRGDDESAACGQLATKSQKFHPKKVGATGGDRVHRKWIDHI